MYHKIAWTAALVISAAVGCESSNEVETRSPSSRRLEDMTWTQVEKAIETGTTTAIVVFASTEQHGPHLPLSVDAITGAEVASRVAGSLGEAIIAPVVTLGASDNHMAFPGTVSLRRETLMNIVLDYGRSLATHGFSEILMIPSHGGNAQTVVAAAEQLQQELPDVCFVVSPSEVGPILEQQRRIASAFGLDSQRTGAHGGEGETSMVARAAPASVYWDAIQVGFIGDLSSVRSLIDREGYSAVSEHGIVGDPNLADAEHGEAYFSAWAAMTLRDLETARETVCGDMPAAP